MTRLWLVCGRNYACISLNTAIVQVPERSHEIKSLEVLVAIEDRHIAPRLLDRIMG